MNFKSHLNEIRTNLLGSLILNKENLLKQYLLLLVKGSELFKTNEYEYWINQIEQIEWHEIPVTKLGVEETKRSWNRIELDSAMIRSRLSCTAEELLTFWDEEGDVCEVGGFYHYYKELSSNKVFGESGYGRLILIDKLEEDSIIRIATITDLKQLGIINISNESLLM